MATTKKKAAKKAATKAAKKPAPNGAAELKAFGAAIRNLKTTGFALAKVAKSTPTNAFRISFAAVITSLTYKMKHWSSGFHRTV